MIIIDFDKKELECKPVDKINNMLIMARIEAEGIKIEAEEWLSLDSSVKEDMEYLSNEAEDLASDIFAIQEKLSEYDYVCKKKKKG